MRENPKAKKNRRESNKEDDIDWPDYEGPKVLKVPEEWKKEQ